MLKLKDHAAEIDFFKFNDSIYYLVVSNETSRLFNNLFSIETFIERNGYEFMKWIMDYSTKTVLNAALETYLTQLDIGYLAVEEKYGKFFECVSSDSFKYQLFRKEFDKCVSGAIDYVVFKKRNGFTLIKYIVTQYALTELVKSEFTKLPRNQLTSVDNKSDRDLFSLGATEIKHVLFQRWSQLFIQQIIEEDSGFFDCVGNDFSIQELRPKVLADTMNMTVIDIAKQFPKLFTTKILTIDACGTDGVTIGGRIAKEIDTFKTFEDVVNGVPTVLFDCKIIDSNTAVLLD